MNIPVDPEDEWMRVLFAAGVPLDRLSEVATRLADAGMFPSHDPMIQDYRSQGHRTEVDWYRTYQPGLPFGKGGGSVRKIASKYGIPRSTLQRRFVRLDQHIADMFDDKQPAPSRAKETR